MIPWQEVMKEIVFSNIDKKGELTIVAVERLLKDKEYIKIKPIPVAVLEDSAKTCFINNGVEPHRLARLAAEDVITHPVTYLDMSDGTHLLADGNHRYVKAYLLRMSRLPARLVPEKLWRRYQVKMFDHNLSPEIVREVLAGGFSGIL